RARSAELTRLQPQNAAALQSLRRLVARSGAAMGPLQLAEVEEALPLSLAQRAQLLAEVGQLWRGLGDKVEARRRFDAALEIDAKGDPALQGAALRGGGG